MGATVLKCGTAGAGVFGGSVGSRVVGAGVARVGVCVGGVGARVLGGRGTRVLGGCVGAGVLGIWYTFLLSDHSFPSVSVRVHLLLSADEQHLQLPSLPSVC